jgi:hypothetical protein
MSSNALLRKVFGILRKRALVIHNGWIDLVMLYHAFWSNLPQDLDTFVADIRFLFPNGVYDTKLIAECRERNSKSVLEYLFRKAERIQAHAKQNCLPFMAVEFPKSSNVCTANATVNSQNKNQLCPSFKRRGFCSKDTICGFSHEIDLLLDADFSNSSNWVERKGCNMATELETNPICTNRNGNVFNEEGEIILEDPDLDDNDTCDVELGNSAHQGPSHTPHSANADAFMTGYVFAQQLQERWVTMKRNDNSMESCPFVHKIYLMGKPYPLSLLKSAYSSYGEKVQLEIDSISLLNNLK